MYPSILVEQRMPISCGKLNEKRPRKISGAELKNFFFDYFLYVVYDFNFSPESCLTNLPVRSDKTKETIYPLNFVSGDGEN